MKRSAFFLVALFVVAAAAQDLPRIAVYVTGGGVSAETREALGAYVLDALVKSGRYRAIERSESFLDEVAREHVAQRSGAIDDAQISRLGKQAGAQVLCVVGVTETLGAYQASARVIDVETADVVASGVADTPLKSLDDLKRVAAAVIYKMLGVRVAADEDFELLSGKEQAAIERSIERSVRETMREKPRRSGRFWVGVSCDVAGAGLLGYGIYQEFGVRNLNDRGDYPAAKEAEGRRNFGYIAGAAVLLAGISIHIFF
jgi:hypothetical protein